MPYSSREKRNEHYRLKRGEDFKPRLPIWTTCNWDSGFVVSNGRFMVKFPDHPKAKDAGYVYRYHAVWFIMTGEIIPDGYCIHHRNLNKLDDRFENLQKITKAEHAAEHHKGRKCPDSWMSFKCETCGQDFSKERYRVNGRKKEGHKIKYCSMKCFYERGKIRMEP